MGGGKEALKEITGYQNNGNILRELTSTVCGTKEMYAQWIKAMAPMFRLLELPMVRSVLTDNGGAHTHGAHR